MKPSTNNLDRAKRYFEPTAVVSEGDILQIYHTVDAPVWTLMDLAPTPSAKGKEMMALIQKAYPLAEPLMVKEGEEPPLKDISPEVWNTFALLFVAGQIRRASKRMTDRAELLMKQMEDAHRMRLVPEANHPELSVEEFGIAPAEMDISVGGVIQFIRFMQNAYAELMQRYYGKKNQRILEKQMMQQQSQGQGGVGVAKQLGLDTGQPVPMSEYGGATYRHKTK